MTLTPALANAFFNLGVQHGMSGQTGGNVPAAWTMPAGPIRPFAIGSQPESNQRIPRPPSTPPRGGIIGPVPPGQPMPPWTGVYPPGTIQNFRPLGASWDETGTGAVAPVGVPARMTPVHVALGRALGY
jgi:hypothetical protein